jgi:hypothetical protein
MIGKVMFCLGVIALLTGCGQEKIQFEGEEKSTDYIGEVLEDRLEDENPDYDLEVEVYTEIED